MMRLTLLAYGPYKNTYSVNKLRYHIEKNELASVPITKNCEGDFTYFYSWLEREMAMYWYVILQQVYFAYRSHFPSHSIKDEYISVTQNIKQQLTLLYINILLLFTVNIVVLREPQFTIISCM